MFKDILLQIQRLADTYKDVSKEKIYTESISKKLNISTEDYYEKLDSNATIKNLAEAYYQQYTCQGWKAANDYVRKKLQKLGFIQSQKKDSDKEVEDDGENN